VKAQELSDLAGKVALVTPASSEVGRHFSEVLAENGAWVGLVARRQDRLAGDIRLDPRQELKYLVPEWRPPRR